MHRMGTVANVLRYITGPEETNHLIVQGESRFRVLEFLDGWPFMVARVELISEPETAGTEIEARFINLRQQALETVALMPQAPQGLANAIQNIGSAASLADMTAAYMDISTDEKQDILETIVLEQRLDKVLALMAKRLEVLRLSAEIGKGVQEKMGNRQREHLLREQLAEIQRQLGEEEGNSAEIAELRKAVEEAGMPEEVEKQALRELRRLEKMPDAAAEYGMIRTYLDWLVELPWKAPEHKPIGIDEARKQLDAAPPQVKF